MMEEIEIPEAIRENVESPQKQGLSLPLISGGFVLLAILGFISWRGLAPSKKVTTVEDIPAVTNSPVSPEANLNQETVPSEPEAAAPTLETPVAKPKIDLLGHLPYDVAPESELVTLSPSGNIKLRKSAAEKFQQMQAAAKADGINLSIISGFRDTGTQEYLFFDIKEQRAQDAAKRAEVSAPPGYSEHHTGYAIDVGDGNAPATDLEVSFGETAAFRWLEQNALKYSFELSFPPDNQQGVSYEPWHWRFVGDRDSLETFYKVRN